MSSLAVIRSDQAFEAQWCAWLVSLPPWEMHVVFLHELEWHDKVKAGVWDHFDVIRAVEAHMAANGSS